ncbi:MAG: cell division protein FtsH [Lautropia sp. SCN 69-89]|nr:MAG: cell division protein FtsH [Lautropia sp. SCN 69-89]
MEKKQQFSIWYLFAALLLIVALQDYLAPPHVDNLPYSDFKSFLRSGKITEVALGEAVITGTLSNDGAGEDLSPKTAERLATLSKGPHPFTTVRVDDRALVGDLEAAKVPFAGRVESKWLPALLSWVIPALVFFALWSFLIKRMAGSQGMGGFMSVGKSKAKVYMETDTKVTFDDVAGVDEAKEELQEVIGFLKDPARYGRLGGRVPKGVLLVGPPGTGKTLLARAVAGQAGVPFFSISGSEFVEMFVGVGAARVRDLFEHARGAFPMGGHDEKEQTLNQLLSEMDGFDPSAGVVLLAATNRPEVLDPALLRAGRFDRQVLVDRPDRKGRVQILEVHLKKVKLASDADPEKIAALTPANLVNEAALLATRRGADAAGLDDFTAAIERIVAGLEKRNRLLNPLERKVVAYHEMGHALVALSLPGVDRVHKISIIPRGIGALGYTIQRPTEDRFLMTREELENKMAVLLGGRASEHLVFGHLSTGAADDLAKATDIARSMAMRYGMEAKLGHVSYEGEGARFLDIPQGMSRRHDFSEEVAREIDRAVKAILDAAFANAMRVLAAHRSILDRGAALLLEKETLDEQNLRELTGAVGSPESAEQPAQRQTA